MGCFRAFQAAEITLVRVNSNNLTFSFLIVGIAIYLKDVLLSDVYSKIK